MSVGGTRQADAPTTGDFDPKLFMKVVKRFGHTAALGLDYRAHGPDWAELVLPYAPALIGVPETGVMASGPIVSLMDMATSVAIWIKRGRFQHHATLDMRIDYLRPAASGRDVVGRGECYRLTTGVAFARGIAHDGDPDDPIAHVAATFVVMAD